MITDKMMTAAAEDLYQAILNSLPDESECIYQFSERFESKMKHLIRRTKHPVRHKILQRAASIALVIFLGFITLLAVSPTVRAAVFGWVKEQYENFATYYYDGDLQDTPDPMMYELGYLPAGFEEVHRNVSPSETSIYYADSVSGNVMSFTYTHEHGANTYNVKKENTTMEKVYINGHSGDFYLHTDSAESNVLVWFDNDTNTLFRITAFMTKDEIMQLAEMVVIVK